MAEQAVVYQTPTQIANRPPSPCSESCVAWSYIPTSHDWPSLLLSLTLPRLNGEFHKGIQWWSDFLMSWHGVSFWLFPRMSASTDLEVTSDVAGSLGFGAYFKNEWFSGEWGLSQSDQSIAYKELFPVVVASHVWGPRWHRCHVLFRSDNEAVVHILTSKTSRTFYLSILAWGGGVLCT